jgi:hypothetical protein
MGWPHGQFPRRAGCTAMTEINMIGCSHEPIV